MPSEFILSRQVEFADTDMAGVVHFSNFFKYMEACETSFLRSLEISLIAASGSQLSGWPRVNASCNYQSPLRFGETFEIRLFVKAVKERTVIYFFHFVRAGGNRPGQTVATGELAVIFAQIDGSSQVFMSAPIPAEVRAKILVSTSPEMSR